MDTMTQALIKQAQPYMFEKMALSRVEGEGCKGCSLVQQAAPVALEPAFRELNKQQDLFSNEANVDVVCEPLERPEDFIRLQAWISPEMETDWRRSEIFLKQLCSVERRVAMEVSGNSRCVVVNFRCHKDDEPIVSSAFLGAFERCEISPLSYHPLFSNPKVNWKGISFRDYSPRPPYSHLLTRPDEFYLSPFETLIASLSRIPENAVGFYQSVFQPVSQNNNWHRNVEILLDFEYAIKLHTNGAVPQRYSQQAPSGDEKLMAMDVERKAHNDKPFYCMAFRIGALSEKEDPERIVRSLGTTASLFQHGGRQLEYLTQNEFEFLKGPKQIREMFFHCLTYRPGFLVNSMELSGPVHLPPSEFMQHRQISIDTLDTLPVPEELQIPGTPIGKCEYAGKEIPVFIPKMDRQHHTLLIGKSGMGKSTTLEHMILDNAMNGVGAAVLDPHGDLVERLLGLMPPEAQSKVIYLDFGDPDWTPVWNPLSHIAGQDISRTADNIVGSIKSVVDGWGDRLEYLLSNSVRAALHLEETSLLDVWNLLRVKSDEGMELREKALCVVENETLRNFLAVDCKKYREEDTASSKHKLGKLFGSYSVALMLSQPDNRFDFRKIMDEGNILLVNLSTIGSEVRNILGGFILSLFHATAFSRASTPRKERKEFHVYCDDPNTSMTPYPDQWEFLSNIKTVSVKRLDEVINQYDLLSNNTTPQQPSAPESPLFSSRLFTLPICAQRMLTEGVQSHQRTSCFRLAVQLRKTGLPRDIAIAGLKAWANKNKPQDGKSIITDREIESQTACAYSKQYRSFGCEDATVSLYCDPSCGLFANRKS